MLIFKANQNAVLKKYVEFGSDKNILIIHQQ